MHFTLPNWLVAVLSEIKDYRMILLIALILTIIITSYVINAILLLSVGGVYRVFVAPGVIVHEMSHALGCVLTGAKIKSIEVFKKEGGEVKHTQPKIPIIGQIIISLAPFVVGFLAIYFLAKVIGVKPIEADFMRNLSSDTVLSLWKAVKGIEYQELKSWLALYLIISIAVTMTPSTRDLRNVFLSLVSLAAIIYFLVRYLSVDVHIDNILRPEFLAILATTTLVLCLALLLSIIVAAIINIFKR